MKRITKSNSIQKKFLGLIGKDIRKLLIVEMFVIVFVLFIMGLVTDLSIFFSCIIASCFFFQHKFFVKMVWFDVVVVSLAWGGVVATIFGGPIKKATVGGDLLCCFFIASIVISLVIHIYYSRLVFRSVRMNNNNLEVQMTADETTYESVDFCPKCGRRIHSIDGRCNACDR